MASLSRKIRITIKILVPAVLLIIIFRNIDPAKLLRHLRGVDLGLLAIAYFFGSIAYILLSTYRWKRVLNTFYQIKIPYLTLLRYFWEGLFIGYFIPAGIGGDIYRGINAGKHSGEYPPNMFIIMVEKIFILAGSMLLLMVIYPMISTVIDSDDRIERLMDIIYVIGVSGCMLGLVLVLGIKTPVGKTLYHYIKNAIQLKITAVLNNVKWIPRGQINKFNLADLLRPCLAWKNVAFLLSFTCLNRCIGCLGGFLLMKAVGVELPLMIHLFVWTALVIIFSLPISIGTLGVSEGAYIVLFGLFGVESEVALAASYAGLACIVTTSLLGGVILSVNNYVQTLKE